MIVYDKLLEKFKEKGVTSYTFKQNQLIGQKTYYLIKNGGNIDTKTINKLCAFLNCQPGDILEYVKK